MMGYKSAVRLSELFIGVFVAHYLILRFADVFKKNVFDKNVFDT
ncbi:MAG: hypothetical protein ACJAY0_000487 [Thalassolituus sp.]|jgi:hypothetical protein